MTTKAKKRLLLNAQPFGFGPSSAIASFFPHLQEHFDLSYAGVGHTLDLQRSLPYKNIYRLDPNTSYAGVGDTADPQRPVRFGNRYELENVGSRSLEEILSDHDLVLTACDFRIAEAARRAGKPTIVYDMLAWFWPEWPPVLRDESVLYIAQDFFGVRERLEREKGNINARVVPPIIPEKSVRSGAAERVLINLGGVQTLFWTTEMATNYARLMIVNIKKALPNTVDLVVVANQNIASDLKEHEIRTYTREEMIRLLPSVKYAFATPGLGNIYDAAGNDIPTVFLPPANASQGLQFEILRGRNLLDASIDWPEILGGERVDYSLEDSVVLGKIAEGVQRLGDSPDSQQRLATAFEAAIANVSEREHSKAGRLIQLFGRGGVKEVAAIVRGYADKISRGTVRSRRGEGGRQRDLRGLAGPERGTDGKMRGRGPTRG